MAKMKTGMIYVVVSGTLQPDVDAVFSDSGKAHDYIDGKHKPLDMNKRWILKIDLDWIDKVIP